MLTVLLIQGFPYSMPDWLHFAMFPIFPISVLVMLDKDRREKTQTLLMVIKANIFDTSSNLGKINLRSDSPVVFYALVAHGSLHVGQTWALPGHSVTSESGKKTSQKKSVKKMRKYAAGVTDVAGEDVRCHGVREEVVVVTMYYLIPHVI